MPQSVWDLAWRDRGVERGLHRVADASARAEQKAKAFKVAVGVGLVAATAVAVKFGVSSVRAYGEAQAAQLRLQDAFVKFPKLADTNIGALRNLNTELAKKTRFDDDATASGQAVLAQFKLTGQQITQLTPLLQDYAAKTGKDLPTAAKDLGRAMLGQGRALKVVGINFKDTGTAGGNFSQIMGGLRTQVGGFAEREGKTAAGQAEILKNQFGELQESVGQALLPALLKVGGGLLKAVNGFNDLDDTTKSVLLTVGGGIATLGLSALAIGKLAASVKVARDAFRALGVTAKGATIATAGIGAVLGVAALAFGAYAANSAKAKQAVEDYSEALKEDNNQLGANVRLMAAKKLQDEGAFEAARKLGIGFDTVTDAALGNVAAQARLNPLLDAYVEAALNSADVDSIDRKNAAVALSSAIGGQNKAVNTAVGRAKELAAAAGTAGAATQGAGAKVKTAGEKAADAEKKLRDLAAAMFRASEGALELSGREISFKQAVADATAAVKTNGRTLDTNTQKGRDNKTALNNLVTSSQAYISKLVETGASSKRVAGATKNAREEFIKVARRMGESRDRAKELADRYFRIPKKVSTKTEQPGMHGPNGALSSTARLDAKINALNDKKVSITFETNAKKFGLTSTELNAARRSRARGGILPGFTPVARGDDQVVNMRSGEGVYVSEAMRNPYERQRLHAVNKAALAGQPLHQFQGLAAGGVVARRIMEHVGGTGIAVAGSRAQAMANAVALGMSYRVAQSLQKRIDALGGGGGPIGGAGFANALRWARTQQGKPYVWTGVGPGGYDCSGFMAALINVIKGRSPYHRLFSTGMAGGQHLAGMTRNKMSPFRIGVWKNNPGHTAGTLNGVNVESSGGVGVRVGGRARGANNGLFNLHYGLARGGMVGDAPYDTTHRGGQRYDPETERLWKLLLGERGLHRGGVVRRPGVRMLSERGPERVLSARQTNAFERMVGAMDRGRGGGNTYNVTVNAPNYVGANQDLVNTMVQMGKRGQMDVVLRSAGVRV